jgi:hypothetical protein
MQLQYSFERDWLQPYVPHSLSHAALILADHIDFWEEDQFRTPDGLYRPRQLSDFISNGHAANRTREVQFRALLQEYISLATESCTVQTRPSDLPFHITRRHNVQIAIADARMWLEVNGHSTAVVGRKRPREQ